MLLKLNSKILPLLNITFQSNHFQLLITNLISINFNNFYLNKNYFLKTIFKKNTIIDFTFIFTKQGKFNKLYIDNNDGLFLSSGIILKFIGYDQKKFLKKRLKIWHNYLKAFKFLHKIQTILIFKDLFGKKIIFFNKLIKLTNLKIKWLFLKLNFNTSVNFIKTKRRIKRWIKKKYYQIGVGEK